MAKRAVVHSKTRLIGKSWIGTSAGYGLVVAVFHYKYETKGQPGIAAYYEISDLVKNAVIAENREFLERVANMQVEDLSVTVFAQDGMATAIFQRKVAN